MGKIILNLYERENSFCINDENLKKNQRTSKLMHMRKSLSAKTEADINKSKNFTLEQTQE